MPFIKSLVFKRFTLYFRLVAIILLLSEVIPTCSYCIEKS